MPETPIHDGDFDLSRHAKLKPASKPRPQPPSDENNLYGAGWVAHRTSEGCTLSWITNHPVAHFVSAEATAKITEADFEQLRQDPDTAHDLILKYEQVQVIE